MKKQLALVLPVALAMTMAGQAAVIDNFETYTLGSNLHGENGWKGWDNVAGAGAVVALDPTDPLNQVVNITGTSDLVREFSGVSSGIWALTMQQFIPSSSTGTSYFILLNQYTDGGPYNWSVQIEARMDSGTINSTLYGSGSLALIKDAWVELRAEINLDTSTVSEYYNNQLLSTHAWHDGSGSNVLAAIDLYANYPIDPDGADPVYYDNLTLTQIPEPGSFALLALGGLGLGLRRRRS